MRESRMREILTSGSTRGEAILLRHHSSPTLPVGHSSRCFSYIRDWVEKKIRCHLARARQRQGFGWKRWSREWLYGPLGLFHEYRVVYQPPSWAAAPNR